MDMHAFLITFWTGFARCVVWAILHQAEVIGLGCFVGLLCWVAEIIADRRI